MSVNKENVKTYLDYLDKEMTIMGVLSGFCAATLALSVDKIIFIDAKSPPVINYWTLVNLYCILYLAGLLFATLFFYRQRSLLAYYYGQISLFLAKDDLEKVDLNMNEADGWPTWKHYKAAWASLSISTIECILMLLSHKIPMLIKFQNLIGLSAPLIIGILYGVYTYAFWKYADYDDPMLQFLKKNKLKS